MGKVKKMKKVENYQVRCAGKDNYMRRVIEATSHKQALKKFLEMNNVHYDKITRFNPASVGHGVLDLPWYRVNIDTEFQCMQMERSYLVV